MFFGKRFNRSIHKLGTVICQNKSWRASSRDQIF